MNHQLMHFLHSLKALLSVPDMAHADVEILKMNLAIADQLVGQMIVQETVLPELKVETYSAYLDILPKIKDAVAGNDVAMDLVSELADICKTADIKSFHEVNRLTGEIQQILLNSGKAGANALCKRLLAIEVDYSQKRVEAYRKRAEQAASEKRNSGGAQNAKEFDEGLLAKFIADTFPEESGIRIVETKFVSGGYSKYTVAIKLAGNKSLPENIILRGDAGGMFGGVSVVDEYQLLVAMHEHGVCVPKSLALEQTGRIFGSPFLLMERAGGKTIGHMFNLPGTNRLLCRDIATKLAKIHSVPVSALGDKIEGANTSNRRKALSWLDEAYAAWKPLNMPSPIYEASFKWLRDNAGILDDAPRGLVHADFGLNNILVDGDKASAILDWEFAHIGCPAYDLGYFYFMAEDLASWDEFLGAYADAGGVVPDSRLLDYLILLAQTRLNTMLCQTVGAYYASNSPGLALTAGIVGNFYDIAALRMAGVLDRVM